jgi:hypothetical protein
MGGELHHQEVDWLAEVCQEEDAEGLVGCSTVCPATTSGGSSADPVSE